MKRRLAALIAVLSISSAAAAAGQEDYRSVIKTDVLAGFAHPDKISFKWGDAPQPGWAAMKGKPRAEGLLGCVDIRGWHGDDNIYLVFVFDSSKQTVSGQIFTLPQLNKALHRHMGTWFSADPGCPE